MIDTICVKKQFILQFSRIKIEYIFSQYRSCSSIDHAKLIEFAILRIARANWLQYYVPTGWVKTRWSCRDRRKSLCPLGNAICAHFTSHVDQRTTIFRKFVTQRYACYIFLWLFCNNVILKITFQLKYADYIASNTHTYPRIVIIKNIVKEYRSKCTWRLPICMSDSLYVNKALILLFSS